MSIVLPEAIEPDILKFAQSEQISTDEAVVRLIQAGLSAKNSTGPTLLEFSPAQKMIGALSKSTDTEIMDEAMRYAQELRESTHFGDLGI
jgi:hypothetical protein